MALSDDAMAIVTEMRALGAEWIFPGGTLTKPLSANAMLALLKRMDALVDTTVHGFRSTFTDWAGEETDFPRDIVEMALGHAVGNAVTRAYERGGRLYGGWWINAPKVVRAMLLIDGEPVVELDYEAIHPTIIAAEKRQALNVAPYEVPSFAYDRQVGKKMFFRILNSKTSIKFDARKDKVTFGNFSCFNEFRDAMRIHLSQISDRFECDYGAYLQRRYSELALRVLNRCMDASIQAFPVHDSFIVAVHNADAVRLIMKEEFAEMFDWNINVK